MRWLRRLVLVGLFRPLARIFTGADVVGREHLPLKGPAILAANHASHVDTFLLLAMYPSQALDRVRPAAAADYFLSNPLMSWFSRTIVGIVPVWRDKAGSGVDVLAPVRAALAAGDIVLIFPEGTRGDGEEMASLKSGVPARACDADLAAGRGPGAAQGGPCSGPHELHGACRRAIPLAGRPHAVHGRAAQPAGRPARQGAASEMGLNRWCALFPETSAARP
jgi:1-acyl-sn-glycerol-3-phosphate acyltransferase